MWRLHGTAYRLDVADKIEIQMLIECSVDRVAGIDQEQRVAVGRSPDDSLGTEIASGAWFVLDDKGLPEMLRERLRDQARRDIRGAAWRERNDDARRACRVIDRKSRAGQRPGDGHGAG